MRAKLTEAGFTKAVIQFARLHGWKCSHFRPAKTAKGWRTAVQGDGKGFPDLVLVRPGRLVVAELKVGTNPLTAEQKVWLALFQAARVEWYVWKPESWGEIERVLGRRDTAPKPHES